MTCIIFWQIKAVVSEGIICETQDDAILWRHAFTSPIVHAWRLINGKLTKINLFNNAHIPRRDLVSQVSQMEWLWIMDKAPYKLFIIYS